MSVLKTVTLPDIGIATTSIGFGCNALLGTNNTRRQALTLLETAYELGIRHFDVARSYEAGDSEDVLGDFARNKRDKITITTKFRINSAGNYHGESAAKAWLRRRVRSSSAVLALRPLLKKALKRGEVSAAPTAVPTPVADAPRSYEKVDIALARRSLETSLRELKTDYVDLFYIHEGEAGDCQPQVLEFLETLKTEGKIRQFGIGSAFHRIRSICREVPQYAPVIQFESSLLEPHVAEAKGFGRRGICTHGALAALPQLKARLQRSDEFAARLSERIGGDVRDTGLLASLLMQFALHENPEGIVLFRSSQPANIRANLRSLTERPLAPEIFPAIASLLLFE